MRILYVIPEFPPHYGGGIATYYDALIPAVAAEGHEVDVLVGSAYTNDRPTRIVDGYRVEFLDTGRRQKAYEQLTAYEALPSLRRTLAAAMALFDQADHGQRYDVVETTDFGLLFLPWVVQNTPRVLVQLHASNGQIDAREPKEGQALQGHIVRLLEQQGLARADALETCGQANAAAWADRLRREVLYCPPPLSINASRAKENGFRRKDASGFVAGRIQYWKGPTVLCEAQARLGSAAPTVLWAGRDTSFRKIGDSMAAYLEATYPEVWEKTVIPLGQLTPQNVALRQVNGGFVIVPSIWDVFNYTAAEAMANGAVVICSDGAGAVDLLEHGRNGFVVPGGDPDALAGAIEHVITLPFKKRKEIGERARETIEQNLDPSRIAQQRVETYHDIDRSHGEDTRGNGWLADALKLDDSDTAASKKQMAFLDQHPLRDILSYVRHKIIDRMYSMWQRVN